MTQRHFIELWLSTLVFSIAIIVPLLFYWMEKRSRRPPRGPGYCGKCGYSVSNLTSFTCPECGSDLRIVGILRAPPQDNPPKTLIPGSDEKKQSR